MPRTVCSFVSYFRRVLRIRDFFLIFLILALVCFGGGFTFSNSFEPGGKVREVYTKFQTTDSANFFRNDINGNSNDGLAAVNGEYLKGRKNH